MHLELEDFFGGEVLELEALVDEDEALDVGDIWRRRLSTNLRMSSRLG